MRRLARGFAAAAGIAAVIAPPAALAINEMFAKDAPIARMTPQDVEIATTALRKALDEGRDGEPYRWSNPATSASGTITPLAAASRQGMPCRGVVFTLEAGGRSSRSAWDICRTPQGWKVAGGR
jgi:surface antigen